MIYYVNQAMLHDGDGSLGTPFRRISEAAKIAKPGDEVLVFPGVYREYVNPERGGTEDAPILYRSGRPLRIPRRLVNFARNALLQGGN